MKQIRICCLLLTLLLIYGCASTHKPAPENRAYTEQVLSGEVLTLRHTVQVRIPGHTVPAIDGLMQVQPAQGLPERVRVVALGGVGLTLFDMTISPSAFHTSKLHPSLGRVPHVQEHIARCIQSIWFTALPALASKDGEVSPEMALPDGVSVTHGKTYEGESFAIVHGPEGKWSVSYIPVKQRGETLIFTNTCPEYSVRIHRVPTSNRKEK